jgi:hypothetical protein
VLGQAGPAMDARARRSRKRASPDSMASDGSQALFQPTPGGAPKPASSYGVAAAPAGSTQRRAATGVWDGPAPTGWRTPAAAPQAAAEAVFNPAKEPRSVLLANGVRLPLLGVAAADAAGVECAPAAAPRCVPDAPPGHACRSSPAHATHALRRHACRAGCLLVEPGCEAAVGAALRAALASTPRDSVFIAAVLPGAPQDAGAAGCAVACGVRDVSLA